MKYYQTSNGEWKTYFIILPFWKKEINMETLLWNKDYCPVNPKHKVDDCGIHILVKEHNFYKWIVSNVKFTWVGLTLLTFVGLGFSMMGISVFGGSIFPIFPPTEDSPTNLEDIWTLEDITDTINGKQVVFRIAILANEHRWKYESEDSLESGKVSEVLSEYIDNLQGYESAKGIIAVGLTSQRGSRDGEFTRAENRMNTIMKEIKTHEKSSNKELYRLNLGKYIEIDSTKNKNQTSIQRRVVIIGIMKKDKKMTSKEIEALLKRNLESGEYSIDSKLYHEFIFKKD